MALLAGAAQVDITPEAGVELMGYGARQEKASGVHDPLYARALYLSPGANPPAGAAALILCADLCLMAPEQAREIRREIGSRTGLAASQVLVSCTHTHSGPDTGLAARAAGRPPPPHCAALDAGLVEASTRAVAEAAPARLSWRRSRAAIGRNRRLADGPLDPSLLVLRVDAGAKTLAVLFSYACHGTVLGHDNLEISADWAGVACEQIRRETGAVALFLLGAHADIDPRTRGLMDLAIPGQSLGLGFEAVRVLGQEVAEAVLAALGAGGPADLDHPTLGTAEQSVRLPLHLGDLSEARAREHLEQRKAELCDLLELAPDAFPRLSQLDGFMAQHVRGLPLSEARRRISKARLYLRDKTGPFLVGGQRSLEVPVQVLRIADAALLGLPLEPTTNVGLDWRARAERRVRFAAVAGIANGWLRYLPHPKDLEHPLAAEHYEVLQSTFVPGACERLLDCGERLLDELS